MQTTTWLECVVVLPCDSSETVDATDMSSAGTADAEPDATRGQEQVVSRQPCAVLLP